MAFVNYSTREINVKIVYYGPGLCGKTANLQYLYSRAPTQNRGRLISLATETERTLFFDFLPMNLGMLHGFKVRFHLYTVPGQVFYEASRKLILKGVDGLLFVVDSDPLRLDANQESWEGLQHNLTGYRLSIPPLPAVIQYNKRDLPGALPVAELHAALGAPELPQFESVATTGTGVFESLKALAKGVLNRLQHETLRTDRGGFAEAGPAAAGDVAGGPPPGGDAGPRPPGVDPQQPPPGPPPAPETPTPTAPTGGRPAAAAPPRPEVAPSPLPGGTARPPATPRPPAPAPGRAPPPTGQAAAPAVAPRPAPAPRRQQPAPPAPRDPAPSAPPAPAPGPAPVKRRGFGWFRRSR